MEEIDTNEEVSEEGMVIEPLSIPFNDQSKRRWLDQDADLVSGDSLAINDETGDVAVKKVRLSDGTAIKVTVALAPSVLTQTSSKHQTARATNPKSKKSQKPESSAKHSSTRKPAAGNNTSQSSGVAKITGGPTDLKKRKELIQGFIEVCSYFLYHLYIQSVNQ
jgi:hypothetical protein